MTSFGETLLDRLRVVDDAMVAADSYPLSPRWWECLGRFYTSGKRTLAIRKGRQVYASKGVFPRIAVATLLVERHVPRGEVRTIACLSNRRGEAADRLLNTGGVLDVMRIPYTPVADTLQIPALHARIVVMTASFKASVGDTTDLIWCDELTRWAEDGVYFAEGTISSVKPSLVTLPNSKLFLVSSPWIDGDYHSRQIDLGDTADQNVEIMPTWEAAPHLTEADCRAMAATEVDFLREYAAIPDDGAAKAPYFDRDSIDAAFRPDLLLDSDLHPEAFDELNDRYTILH